MGKILNVMTTKILEGINALALRLTICDAGGIIR